MIVVISRTEGEGSGAEITLCHLLSNFGHDYALAVITACSSSVAAVAKEKGIPLFELSFVKEKIVPNIRLIEQCLKKLKSARLIHAWNSKSFEVAWYISKRLGIPMTCTLHDHPKSFYYTPRKLWLIKRISNSSKAVVSVSDKLRFECLRYGYKSPITTIHNCLPDVPVSKEKMPKSAELKIGFLGMNSVVKGFPVIAEWIRQTAESKRFRWYLFGAPIPEYTTTLGILQQDGLTNFEVMGRQTPHFIFGQVEVLVHASTSFDCFPTVLLEAARAGKPSLASSLGGADEIVENNVSGYVFDPAFPEQGLDCLKNFLQHDTATHFSKNARKIYESRFGIEKMVTAYKIFWQENAISKPSR